jgi:hypothetical protein
MLLATSPRHVAHRVEHRPQILLPLRTVLTAQQHIRQHKQPLLVRPITRIRVNSLASHPSLLGKQKPSAKNLDRYKVPNSLQWSVRRNHVRGIRGILSEPDERCAGVHTVNVIAHSLVPFELRPSASNAGNWEPCLRKYQPKWLGIINALSRYCYLANGICLFGLEVAFRCCRQ